MNRKLEILLVEDDPAACKEIAGHVDDSDDLILIGVTSNSTNAVELIKDKCCYPGSGIKLRRWKRTGCIKWSECTLTATQTLYTDHNQQFQCRYI